MRQTNKATKRLKKAKRGKGKFCPCCCEAGIHNERRLVNRARRREGKAITREAFNCEG